MDQQTYQTSKDRSILQSFDNTEHNFYRHVALNPFTQLSNLTYEAMLPVENFQPEIFFDIHRLTIVKLEHSGKLQRLKIKSQGIKSHKIVGII